ncbi:Mbeg1-like protein [Lagierella sp.]|uniref:Mbeg1-like protein n=1 Tax=Lagierella sp. TaxID=2849657 RepID=UPI0026245144|nr:Mbeg1-like protein [Lagierella sp.]
MTYNIYDYLNFRGDITFLNDDLNPIDAVIFARLSYLPMGLCMDENDEIPLGKLAHKLVKHRDFENSLVLPEDAKLLKSICNLERYKDIQALGFRDEIDLEIEKQFSAISFKLPNSTGVISFRGTDKTLVGWKEDFNLSFLDYIPSQQDATNYLDHMAKDFKSLILTGHSKGGNLALFSLTHCKEESYKKIVGAYNFDGPGLQSKILKGEVKRRANEKMTHYIPEGSVVGTLLEQEGEIKIVSSTEKNFAQHDIFYWGLAGPDFNYLPDRSPESKFAEFTLKEWMLNIPEENRKMFFKYLYKLFYNIGKTEINYNFTNADFIKTIGQLTLSLKDLPSNQRKMILDGVVELFKTATKNFNLMKQ